MMTVDTLVALAIAAGFDAQVHGDGGQAMVRAPLSERTLAVAVPEGADVRLRLPAGLPAAKEREITKAFAHKKGAPPRRVHVDLSGEALPDDPATQAWLAPVTDLNVFALVETLDAHGGVVPDAVPRTEIPHLRRCIKAGLLTRPDNAWRLTPMGEAAVAAYRARSARPAPTRETVQQRWDRTVRDGSAFRGEG